MMHAQLSDFQTSLWRVQIWSDSIPWWYSFFKFPSSTLFLFHIFFQRSLPLIIHIFWFILLSPINDLVCLILPFPYSPSLLSLLYFFLYIFSSPLLFCKYSLYITPFILLWHIILFDANLTSRFLFLFPLPTPSSADGLANFYISILSFSLHNKTHGITNAIKVICWSEVNPNQRLFLR